MTDRHIFKTPCHNSSKHLKPEVNDLFQGYFTSPESCEGQPGCYTLLMRHIFSVDLQLIKIITDTDLINPTGHNM